MKDEVRKPVTELRDKLARGEISRREFLRQASLLGLSLAAVETLTACAQPAATAEPTAQPAVQTAPTARPVAAAPGLRKAMGHITYNGAKCASCRTCMVVCSLYHEGAVNPELARIQAGAAVLDIFEATGITCKQCDNPQCVAACPEGAMSIDTTCGARVIDAAKCTGCKLCMEACPQYPNTPIRFDPERNMALKCDLCGGDPQCVKFCPKSVALTPHLYPEEDRVLKFVKLEA